MPSLLTEWTTPETWLRRFEMPVILVLGGMLFGLALTVIDTPIWRMAMTIPFAGAGLALLTGLYVAIRHVDDWA